MIKRGMPALGIALMVTTTLVAGRGRNVKNYRLNDHFSAQEVSTGSTSTREQCAQTRDAVWVPGSDDAECIRYFPSDALKMSHVDRAVVFMEVDNMPEGGGIALDYAKGTPQKWLARSNLEQKRDGGLAVMYLGHAGTDGSSGDQHRRRTHYETQVENAAIDKIKLKYGIQHFGLVGQSGGRTGGRTDR
jgi:hypothetical protein